MNSPGSFTTYTRTIKDVEVVDPLTVRITTQVPNPSLLVDLARVAVINRRTHENATTDEFNAGTMAIGTGPYRCASPPGRPRAAGAQRGMVGDRPARGRVDYRIITNDPARTAALRPGDVDIIDQVADPRPRPVHTAASSVQHPQRRRNIFLCASTTRRRRHAPSRDTDGKPPGPTTR